MVNRMIATLAYVLIAFGFLYIAYGLGQASEIQRALDEREQAVVVPWRLRRLGGGHTDSDWPLGADFYRSAPRSSSASARSESDCERSA
jgi:hypothetical protein